MKFTQRDHNLHVLKELAGMLGITVVASLLGTLVYVALLGGV